MYLFPFPAQPPPDPPLFVPICSYYWLLPANLNSDKICLNSLYLTSLKDLVKRDRGSTGVTERADLEYLNISITLLLIGFICT